VEALLAKAFDGMDAALLQTVEANRKALTQFVDQGVGVQDKQMKSALANLEKMEDMFFDTVTKAAKGAAQPMQGPWDHVLGAMKEKGTATGAQATMTVEQLIGQTQTALRDGRATVNDTDKSANNGFFDNGAIATIHEGHSWRVRSILLQEVKLESLRLYCTFDGKL